MYFVSLLDIDAYKEAAFGKRWYEQLPDESLADVMWEIAEEREKPQLIDADELRRRVTRHYQEAYARRPAVGDDTVMRRRWFGDVLAVIDDLQGR